MNAQRIGLQVVEFELRTLRREPTGGEGVEFAVSLQNAKQRYAGIAVFLVARPVESRQRGQVVSDKQGIRADQGADTVQGVAATVTGGEEVRTIHRRPLKDCSTLHPARNGLTGGLEHGWGEVDEADQTVLDAARRHAWSADQQGNLQTFHAQPLFAPRHRTSVVGEEHHQGILQDAFRFELSEDRPHALIDDFDATFIGIPVATAQRVLGIIRRELDGRKGGFVEMCRNREGAMRFRDLKLGEEGLSRATLPPVVAVE